MREASRCEKKKHEKRGETRDGALAEEKCVSGAREREWETSSEARKRKPHAPEPQGAALPLPVRGLAVPLEAEGAHHGLLVPAVGRQPGAHIFRGFTRVSGGDAGGSGRPESQRMLFVFSAARFAPPACCLRLIGCGGASARKERARRKVPAVLLLLDN